MVAVKHQKMNLFNHPAQMNSQHSRFTLKTPRIAHMGIIFLFEIVVKTNMTNAMLSLA